ncbi:hypothetical protein BGZ95_005360 [Linnemannia exigua]|uniref:F-box domain-containing protein n=1 Tax=Linnemannia exigua TaxID=604196 RepID=A0AAD4DJ10_9FUNG|nr:hypothetical protein BGZ95_005360 [Linnemannia exigua]
MTTQHEALEIPEILRRISTYLPGPDFTSCLQTCHSFHTILTPLLYNQLTLVQKEEKRPTLEALARYAHLVGALKFEHFMSAEYLNVGFKGLYSIHIVHMIRSREFQVGTDEEIMDALLRIIRENPALRKWTLHNPWPRLSSKVWKELSSLKKNPTQGGSDQRQQLAVQSRGCDVLDLTSITVTHDAKHWFLRACADARELRILDVSFMVAGGNPDNCQLFLQLDKRPPQGRRVEIVEFHGYDVIHQLTFLSHLVEARHISWTSPAAGRMPIQTRPLPTLEDLKQFIKPTTWPKLRSLDLTGIPGRQLVRFSDECISHILGCLPDSQLEEFKLQGSTFGPLSAAELKRQLSCLQDLRLEPAGIQEQSALIQEVMESCPKLKVLRAGMISVGHMRRGKPWVCHGLKELAVQIDLESDRDGAVVDKEVDYDTVYFEKHAASRRYVFERLSKLTELVELDTSLPYYGHGDLTYYLLSNRYQSPYWTLEYQIPYGLDQLASLKKLEKLKWSNNHQRIYKEDLAWMADNLPSLKTICAEFDRNATKHKEMAAFLLEKGITVGAHRYR